MNCGKHSSQPAVAQCQNCGAGVCSVCKEKTSQLQETHGVLCVDCYKETAREIGSYYVAKKAKAQKSLIISVVLFIIGAITMLVGGIMLATVDPNSSDAMGNLLIMVVGWVLMGALPGIKAWNDEARAQEEHERKYGAKYVVTESGDIKKDTNLGYRLMMVFFRLVFGPFSTIFMWFGFRSIMKECDEMTSGIMAELQELENI